MATRSEWVLWGQPRIEANMPGYRCIQLA